MIRAFLAVLAALVVVLAFVLDRAWLYGAAAAALVGVLGVLGRHLWQAYRRSAATEGPGDASSAADSLEDLGIMEVREQGSSDATASQSSAESAASSSSAQEPAQAAASAAETSETGDRWPEGTLSAAEKAALSGPSDGASSRQRYTEGRPVLGPYLESLRAALGATSACLLVQEEVVLEYRIEALAGVEAGVSYSGTFETREPLLSATMSRRPVTVQSIDPGRRQDLGYYGTAPEITQVAVAPIERSDSSATVFLLVDAAQEVDLGTRPARSLLEEYADLGALLLDLEAPISGDEAATERLQSFVDAGEAAAASADGDAAPVEPVVEGASESPDPEDEPRPRRDIIAEEMEAADAADAALALVLVHLNRAESIARRGDEAVASAERHLQSRLEDLAPGPRVERFGELTYGLFVRRSVDEVEGWAAELQETMARETGELEGGVSVGVAVRHEAHDPESLRADATDALLEAYETGTCTIIA